MNDAPTPARIDQAAAEYFQLKEKADEAMTAAMAAAEPVQKKADELKDLVDKYGQQHAEKSKILHGLKWELVVTFGSSTSVDAIAVEAFRLALVKAKQSRLLKQLFEKTIRYTLNPKASTIVRDITLAKPLLALWAKCQIIKPRAPSLNVREKSA